uniref:C2H2-type domain-containing protein n=1 Tax=Anopheles atroparvus TaxID=41427 RepID=A0AAG5D7K6_ANOAO
MLKHGRKIMTRIRTSGIQSYGTTSVLSLHAQAPSSPGSDSMAMESSIIDPADALAGGGRDVLDNDVDGSSPLHHPSTLALMNGVTITITSHGSTNNNNTIGTADEDDDKCGADKDGSDLRAIDFANEPNHHHHPEPQESVLDFDASAAHDDNDGHVMMMAVDSMAVAEIAISTNSSSSSSSNSSSSNSSNSSSSSSSSSNSSNSSTSSSNSSTEVAANQPKLEEIAADEEGEEEEEEEEEDGVDGVDEEVDDEEEEEEEDAHAEAEGDKQAVPSYVSVDESTHEKIMHTDEDPLLQETINALMNGTGGIEVVNSPNTANTTTVSTALAAAVAAVAAEMTNERSTTDELETDRNYECTYCGKLFTRSNTLSYHLKVHTGERPFKCKHCSKAFREQYRLMKHLKTHAKCRNRRMEREGQEYVRVPNGREHLQRRSSAASLAAQALAVGKSLASPEQDCGTGDSERFFKHYELPDGADAMKLEPDISLTEEGGIPEVPDADAMLTEEVEVMDEGPLSMGEMDETTGQPGVTLTDASDIRHQIIEERIKSLQREVHLVNQNLNRVESKVDGLTRIISLLIEKFEEDVDPTGQTQQQRQAAISQTISTEGGSIVPVTSLTVVAPSTPVPHSPSTSMQPKALLLTSTPTQQTHVYTHVTTVGQSAQQLQQTIVPLKESRTGNTHYYQFAEPSIGHSKTTATATSVTVTPSPSPTPPPPSSSAQTQQLTLATTGGGATGGGIVAVNGNQLLDTFPEIPELPIRTVSDFLDLNDHCTDNEQFLLQMMIRLHQEIHNSQPFQRNIKRMMEALVTYEVLCQFSWSGKSAINGQYTKYVFGNSLGIIDLLTKTLNLGKSAEEAEANQKPIFSAIQSFIKHSRQNMIRDSRKRREPMRAGVAGGIGSDTGGGGSAGGMSSDGGGAITFHLNGSDQFQTKLIKSEHPSQSDQQEIVNPF